MSKNSHSTVILGPSIICVGDTVYFLRDCSLIIDICEGQILEKEFEAFPNAKHYVVVKTQLGEQRLCISRIYATKHLAALECQKRYRRRLEKLTKEREILNNKIYLVSLGLSKLVGESDES